MPSSPCPPLPAPPIPVSGDAPRCPYEDVETGTPNPAPTPLDEGVVMSTYEELRRWLLAPLAPLGRESSGCGMREPCFVNPATLDRLGIKARDLLRRGVGLIAPRLPQHL